jgi:hypothetical protein
MLRFFLRPLQDCSGATPLAVALIAVALTVALSFTALPLQRAIEYAGARVGTGLQVAGGAEDPHGNGCPPQAAEPKQTGKPVRQSPGLQPDPSDGGKPRRSGVVPLVEPIPTAGLAERSIAAGE